MLHGMRNVWIPTIVAAAALTGCAVSDTGRTQLLLYGEQEMVTLGTESFEEATSQYPVLTGTADARMVQDIGRRIVAVANYDVVPAEAWEFRLLDAPDVVNAFALPGGKVAVYTGLLKVTQNPDALAAVIGHEIAHVTQSHGNERISQATGAQFAQGAVDLLLSSWEKGDETTKGLISGAFGVGAQFGVLMPFGREHESEADLVGLRYLVRAGFDPYEAPKLWERMAELSGGGGFEFFSTHPSSERRAAELREAIPRIIQEESGAGAANGAAGSGH